MEIQVRDWVRFQRDGRLAVGVVDYLGFSPGGSRVCVTSDHGEVFVSEVLEVRRPVGAQRKGER